MLALLAGEFEHRIPWPRMHWFISDERFVSHDDPLSNIGAARRALLDGRAPAANIHAMRTDTATPEDAARDYQRDLQAFYGSDTLDPARPGFASTRIWVTEGAPAKVKGVRETINRPPSLEPPAKGSVLRCLDFPPEASYIKKVTAADVAFTFQTIKSRGYSGPLAGSFDEVTVTPMGADTVIFQLSTPLGGFLYALTQPLLPAHLLEGLEPAEIATSDFASAPVGTGPFRLAAIDDGTFANVYGGVPRNTNLFWKSTYLSQ